MLEQLLAKLRRERDREVGRDVESKMQLRERKGDVGENET